MIVLYVTALLLLGAIIILYYAKRQQSSAYTIEGIKYTKIHNKSTKQ